MGHYCRICGATKSNESFSGKGHRTHVCKQCARMPKDKRDSIEQEEEIFNFLRQSHISNTNVKRLKALSTSADQHIAELADIVLQVAHVKPYKKLRLKVMAKQHKALFQRLIDTGLVDAHHY